MKTVDEIYFELSQLKKQIRQKIIQALQSATDQRVDIGADEVENLTYVYYSDDNGLAYEGVVTAVWHEEDVLNIRVCSDDNVANLGEDDFVYALQSHKWLISILENICEVLKLDINQL